MLALRFLHWILGSLTVSVSSALPVAAQGEGFEFDGVDDLVVVPQAQPFPAVDMSMTLWVRLDPEDWPLDCLSTKTGPGGRILAGRGNQLQIVECEDRNAPSGVSRKTSLPAPGQLVLRFGGTLTFTYESDCDLDVNVQSDVWVADGGWHFVAVTRELTKAGVVTSLWVDGVPAGPVLSPLIPTDSSSLPFTLGAIFTTQLSGALGSETPKSFLRGALDEVTLWDRALDEAEVEALRTSPPAPGAPGLYGYWSFDAGDVSGQQVLDRSGNGNHGLLGETALVDGDEPQPVTTGMPGSFQEPAALAVSGGTLGQTILYELTGTPNAPFFFCMDFDPIDASAAEQALCAPTDSVGSVAFGGGPEVQSYPVLELGSFDPFGQATFEFYLPDTSFLAGESLSGLLLTIEPGAGCLVQSVSPNTTTILASPGASYASSTSQLQPLLMQSLTALKGGLLLAAGGMTEAGAPVATWEIFDPSTEEFVLSGSLQSARAGHTATLLHDGRVLLVGGVGAGGVLNTVEIFDPCSLTSVAGPSMSTPRILHTATSVDDGARVVIVGGSSGYSVGDPLGHPSSVNTMLSTARIFESADGAWSAPIDLGSARSMHTAVLLPATGDVYVMAGLTEASGPTLDSGIGWGAPANCLSISTKASESLVTSVSCTELLEQQEVSLACVFSCSVLTSGGDAIVLMGGASPNLSGSQLVPCESVLLHDPSSGATSALPGPDGLFINGRCVCINDDVYQGLGGWVDYDYTRNEYVPTTNGIELDLSIPQFELLPYPFALVGVDSAEVPGEEYHVLLSVAPGSSQPVIQK